MDWVAVETFAVRIPAEICAAHLRGSGLDVRVLGDDAGGVAPHFGLLGSGVRVEVPAHQLEEARDVLRSAELDGEF